MISFPMHSSCCLKMEIFTISLSHPSSLLKKLWHKVKLIPYPSIPAQPTKTTNDGFPVCIIFLSGAIPQIQREMTSPHNYFDTPDTDCVAFISSLGVTASRAKEKITFPVGDFFRQFLFSWK